VQLVTDFQVESISARSKREGTRLPKTFSSFAEKTTQTPRAKMSLRAKKVRPFDRKDEASLVLRRRSRRRKVSSREAIWHKQIRSLSCLPRFSRSETHGASLGRFTAPRFSRSEIPGACLPGPFHGVPKGFDWVSAYSVQRRMGGRA